MFMDIRVLLNANNRTETDFSDEPLFLRKSAHLSICCTFLFKEIGICTILSENRQRRRANHFHSILEYSLMPIIVQKQILLTSLCIRENLPN